MKQYIQSREPIWAIQERRHYKQVLAGQQGWKKQLENDQNRIRLREQAFARAKENRLKPTPAEAYFKGKIDELNIRYTFEYVYFYKTYKYRIIDFYLPDYRLSIELDGGYHKEKEIKEYDRCKDSKTFILLYRFTNKTIFKDSFWDRFMGILRKRKLKLNS